MVTIIVQSIKEVLHLKKRYLFVLLFLFLLNCTVNSQYEPIAKKMISTPEWVDVYKKQRPQIIKFFDDGTFEEVKFTKDDILVRVKKTEEKYTLIFYCNGKPVKQFLTSQEGFTNINWSKNGKYFSVVNLTYVGDWVYDGDLYIFSVGNKESSLILKEKGTGAGAVGFSNNNKYVAYGVNNKLIINEIITKKKRVIQIPSEEDGSISFIAWNEDDSKVFLKYVVSNAAIDYIVSL